MGKRPGKTELVTLADFTKEFFAELKHGQIIGFKQEDGSIEHWRVSKVWHKKNQAWLQPWELFDADKEGMDKLEAARKASA